MKSSIWLMLVLAAMNCAADFTLKDSRVEVSVDSKGNLVVLKNLATGQNYAAGKPLWRLYFDRKDGEKENQVLALENTPEVHQESNRIELRYRSLKVRGGDVRMRLVLKITVYDGLVRFDSEVANNEPHTIVRELHYPLVGNCKLPSDHKILTTFAGGQLFPDPVKHIVAVGNNPAYMGPSQFFRQMELRYPSHTVANCFGLIGDSQGLYFGSHDPAFQDTWHGLRVYPDETGAFTQLEAGLYKYPNCLCGKTWSCSANVVAPYSGNWHQTSKIYRKWADTWWHHREAPMWVQKMKGWQRVIFRHQYGETLFRYTDLNGRMRTAGESVGVNTVLAFAWWQAGMDNGYPDSYAVTDPEQGGDAGWTAAIADYRKNGGRVLVYFNGKLIDRESAFYKSGGAKEVCYKDNTGAEYSEQYRFKGLGTFTGLHNARTFVVADTRKPEWRKRLLTMADRAIQFGADSVFYDQLGYCEPTSDWDVSGEFPIPNTHIMADKADTLKTIHDYLDSKGNKEFALGTECFTDVTAQHVDYIHNMTGATSPVSFTEWARFTFPEVILSDREIRDDSDIPHRVNHNVLKGLRNDIEIYRCRDLIDKTPIYQQYLAKVNQLRDKYCDLLLVGAYRDTEGVISANPKFRVSAFVNGNRMAVVVTQRFQNSATTQLRVPGYSYVESGTVGGVKIATAAGEQTVTIGRDELAILIYRKD